ncbi:hypothetical protein [Vibrio crassostreae]|uniref:hypothetical protein n=1 Tax=Vibrio crassostreae TaxID=246167 RepID=UPI001B30BD42|nr:hypothetical protein [Vibrio crassostreae]
MSLFEKEVLDSYNKFAGRMSNLIVLQKVAKDSFSKEISACIEQAENLKDSQLGGDLPISAQNMTYYCLETGEARFYGFSKVTVEEQKMRLFEHKNKQYQWLLAEAYEIYAEYLETIYACAGYCDQNLWLMADFGNIPYSTKIKHDMHFYKQQASKKKDKPKSILTQFRRVFPCIESIEINNAHKINIQLSISLIKNLRHIIVHEGGIVNNKEMFIQKVLKECSLYNSKSPNEKHITYIDNYFGDKEYENLILLLEKTHTTELPLHMFTDRLGNLIDLLVAHASLITTELHKHITND